jgi:hypothetical protein
MLMLMLVLSLLLCFRCVASAPSRFQKKNVMDVLAPASRSSHFNRTVIFGVPISYYIEDIFFSVGIEPLFAPQLLRCCPCLLVTPI